HQEHTPQKPDPGLPPHPRHAEIRLNSTNPWPLPSPPTRDRITMRTPRNEAPDPTPPIFRNTPPPPPHKETEPQTTPHPPKPSKPPETTNNA
ncbi:MAG: hypothetical protein ACE5Z5_03925, partial [Candidatus Bathyarchaeia archaeon]